MLTDAVWTDFDGDGREDLVLAGTWTPVMFFKNTGQHLQNITPSTGLPPLTGWWYSLATGDFNNNGHIDIVAGNLGLNHTFTTSSQNPFGVYAADFNENRYTEIIFTQREDGRDYPFFGLAKHGRANQQISIQFPTFEGFSNVPIQQFISSQKLNNAIHYQADTFASVYLRNNGDGTFSSFELPALAQISPIKSIIVHDVEGDANLDLIVAGNIYRTDPEIPRADAGNGLWLRGDGNGNFEPVPPFESGFLAPLDVKRISMIQMPNSYGVVVANNSDALQIYKMQDTNRAISHSASPLIFPVDQ
jgi:hypothetical protein